MREWVGVGESEWGGVGMLVGLCLLRDMGLTGSHLQKNDIRVSLFTASVQIVVAYVSW